MKIKYFLLWVANLSLYLYKSYRWYQSFKELQTELQYIYLLNSALWNIVAILLQVINNFEKISFMKRIFFMLGILALITNGCGNSGAAEKNKKDKDDAVENKAAESLNDLKGSRDVKTLLAQNWENKEDAQEAALSGGSGAFDMPYRGFSFFADGTVVQDPRDNIRIGKWAMDNGAKKTITITYNDGTKSQYTIESIGAKNMVLSSNADKKKIEYKADGKAQKNMADDPFYTSNNKWRIKPKKSETDEAIKQRLQDCINFYAKFLQDNIARGGTSVSFIGFPTIFKWYNGGISVIPQNKVEEKWIGCFYNEAQALKAQAMLENIITKKYKWDKNETNWVKQDADVLKQIGDTLAITPITK